MITMKVMALIVHRGGLGRLRRMNDCRIAMARSDVVDRELLVAIMTFPIRRGQIGLFEMSALVTILSQMEKGRNSSFEPQKMKLGSKNLFKKLNINLILIYVFSIFFL